MINKDELRQDFSKKPKEYYTVKTFTDEGFGRKQCKECHKHFWTTDSDRELCGDPSHEPYSFMREKTKDIEYSEFWNKFSKFFKDEGHAIIERYPVVSRWRQDLYFTIASIQDFQRLENGRISFEYNANPLLVPQICMRFNDIPNVGVTGRHFTSFMMAGQHAFDYPKEGYWRDRTIELDYKFLVDVLGVKRKDLTYVEDVWAMGDFSEFGPCLEGFANGLELVNNVFTQFEYQNNKISELKGKVVDVGWGFERLMWFYAGTQTAYDAVFRKELDYIYKSTGIKPDHKLYSKIAAEFGKVDVSEIKDVTGFEKRILDKHGVSESDYNKIIKPMQASYAIADHARSLLFGITDGALPSNVGGGYNLRIILRRAFDFMKRYNMDFEMVKLMELMSKDLSKVYKGQGDSLDEIQAVIDTERKRYENAKTSAHKIVDQIIEKKTRLTKEYLKTLYESNGVTPDFISSVASSKGVKLDIPEEVYTEIVKSDFVAKKKEPKQSEIGIDGLPKTEKLFYNNFATESESKVIKAEGNCVVLDKTPFYAESGGQEADMGTIDSIPVKDVQSIDGVIIHMLDRPAYFKPGAKVHCEVDMERRLRLMAHHTATHLISAAARGILGKHAWQEGAKKSADKAHIDISHYEKLSDEQVREIEATANSYILHGIRVSVDELDRRDAETKYGFSIYQGHGVPASKLRIVRVDDLKGKLIDAEACGGLHLAGRESTIGIIKITSTARIHDGINRIEFVAGPAALEHINSLERSIDSVARVANVDKDKLHEGLSSKLTELKDYRSKYSSMEGQLAEYIARDLHNDAANKDVLVKELDLDRNMLRQIANTFVEQNKKKAAVLHNKSNDIVAIAGAESKETALDMANSHAKAMKKTFKGGGSKRIAEGRLV